MHVAMLFAFCFAAAGSISIKSILVTALVVGFVMIAGTLSLNRSRSSVKPSERILTKEVDDNGVPLFFDLNSYREGGNGPARPAAACRTPAPRRRDLF